MANKKGGLGKGLDALFTENSTESESAVKVRLSDIEPNRNQPRKDFDEESINELADSIVKHGLIQPIVVCPKTNGTYEIIAGERRWRACRKAELETVPVIIKDIDDKAVMELALIENLQREDLNSVEEALGYKSLMDTYGLTQEQVSETVGKSRSAVANALRLLGLNADELEALRKGLITAGHARALLSFDNKEKRLTAFNMALEGASVREIERFSKQTDKKPSTQKNLPRNTYFKEVELALTEELGRKVSVKATGKNSGTITLQFLSEKELFEFVKKLTD